MDLSISGLLSFIVTLVVSAVVIWLAQKIVLPREKEKGIISVLALAFVWSIIEFLLSFIFSIIPLGVLEGLIVLILWIWVLKSWFNVGWLQAAGISLVAWIIMLLIGFFLGMGSFTGLI
ncbi:MAG: hypothetical protein LM591_05285 [Candidatus Korarchaeum sp.]|jgi:hypothetical protein|nr:hypothetical protein [Candidatus Korarchaeum sp.]